MASIGYKLVNDAYLIQVFNNGSTWLAMVTIILVNTGNDGKPPQLVVILSLLKMIIVGCNTWLVRINN